MKYRLNEQNWRAWPLKSATSKTTSSNSEQLTGTVQAVTVKVSQNGDWKVVYCYHEVAENKKQRTYHAYYSN